MTIIESLLALMAVPAAARTVKKNDFDAERAEKDEQIAGLTKERDEARAEIERLSICVANLQTQRTALLEEVHRLTDARNREIMRREEQAAIFAGLQRTADLMQQIPPPPPPVEFPASIFNVRMSEHLVRDFCTCVPARHDVLRPPRNWAPKR